MWLHLNLTVPTTFKYGCNGLMLRRILMAKDFKVGSCIEQEDSYQNLKNHVHHDPWKSPPRIIAETPELAVGLKTV